MDELKKERQFWDDSPDKLLYKEMHNPYNALKKMFRGILL